MIFAANFLLMTIVWGHNNFRLKTVHPHEIGLFDEPFKNITFELRQKYAHLFWIPFFPLGKVWTVNRGDGKKYVCHQDIVQMLNQLQLGKSKASIFAWSGFLLIIAGVIIFNIMEQVNHIKWQHYEEVAFAEKAERLNKKVDSVAINDLYLFNQKEANEKYYSYKKTPLKVLSVNGDKVLMGVWTNNSEAMDASDNSGLVRLVNKYTIEDSFWMEKAMLKNAIATDEKNKNSFPGIVVKNLSADAVFKLDEITAMPKPILKQDYRAEANSKSYVEIVNSGLDVRADSIVPITKGVNWQLSKARSLKQGEHIAIKTSDIGKALLHCTDMQHNHYIFEVSNEAGWAFNETKN